MDHWKESAITNKGNELLNEMMAGRNFVLTRAIGGSGLVEASELAGQTALVNPKQQLSIVEERTDSAGKNIEIQVFNKGVTEEYPIQQVGVYGKLEGDEEDVLVLLMQDKNHVTVPAESEGYFLFSLFCFIKIVNTGRFQVDIDTAGIASHDYVRRKIAEHNEDPEAHPSLLSTATKALAVATGGEKWAYSEEKTYPLGAYCNRDGKLYRSIVSIDAPEEWVAEHWEETTVAEEMATIGTVAQNAMDAATGGDEARFSEEKPYSVGDYCSKDGVLYVCTTEITKGEEWNPSHWEATNTTKELQKVVHPKITVHVTAGSVVTCSKGSISMTAIAENGQASFAVSDYGDWTLQATLDEKNTGAETVIVEQVKEYRVKLLYAKVFGVMWNYANPSTELTRLNPGNDPNGLANMTITGAPSPAVGTGAGSSPFDSFYPWAGMEEYNIIGNEVGPKRGEAGFSRTAHDTMVYIPEFFFKVIHDSANNRIYYYIADGRAPGFEKHPGSGNYLGRYNTGEGHVSKSGTAPLARITRNDFRVGATGKGSKWSQYDYATWCAVWLLYLVEFSNWDSQAKIGKGYTNTGHTAAIDNGGTDVMAYHTGRPVGTDGDTAVQYRHIENPWGNVWDFIDGININDGNAYICTDHTKFADDTTEGYVPAGIPMVCTNPDPNGGGIWKYIKGLGVSEIVPWGFFPNVVDGSEVTYVADGLISRPGWLVLLVGGSWLGALHAGLFSFDFYELSSFAYANFGGRLLKKP